MPCVLYSTVCGSKMSVDFRFKFFIYDSSVSSISCTSTEDNKCTLQITKTEQKGNMLLVVLTATCPSTRSSPSSMTNTEGAHIEKYVRSSHTKCRSCVLLVTASFLSDLARCLPVHTVGKLDVLLPHAVQ